MVRDQRFAPDYPAWIGEINQFPVRGGDSSFIVVQSTRPAPRRTRAAGGVGHVLGTGREQPSRTNRRL
jgi:hypothetical protein